MYNNFYCWYIFCIHMIKNNLWTICRVLVFFCPVRDIASTLFLSRSVSRSLLLPFSLHLLILSRFVSQSINQARSGRVNVSRIATTKSRRFRSSGITIKSAIFYKIILCKMCMRVLFMMPVCMCVSVKRCAESAPNWQRRVSLCVAFS